MLALFAGPGSQIFTSSHLLIEEFWANQFGSKKRLTELFAIKEHFTILGTKVTTVSQCGLGKDLSKMMVFEMLKQNFSVHGFGPGEAQRISCELFLSAWHVGPS